jgi:hypothetical protein
VRPQHASRQRCYAGRMAKVAPQAKPWQAGTCAQAGTRTPASACVHCNRMSCRHRARRQVQGSRRCHMLSDAARLREVALRLGKLSYRAALRCPSEIEGLTGSCNCHYYIDLHPDLNKMPLTPSTASHWCTESHSVCHSAFPRQTIIQHKSHDSSHMMAHTFQDWKPVQASGPSSHGRC